MPVTRQPKEPGESFVVTSLDDRGFTLRPLLWGVSLALIVVLIAAGMAFFARRAPRSSPASVGPTAVPSVTLPTGWHIAGRGIQAVAFAPSDSTLGYACGASPQGIFVVRTKDGGDQWSAPSALNDHDSACAVAVDPTAPGDVVVNTGVVWRSTDAGYTWHAWPLPNVKPGLPSVSAVAWAGTTLFAAFVWSPYYQHTLVASVAGAPFASADPPLAALGGDPGQPSVAQLFGAGGTIYAGFHAARAADGLHFIHSADGGQTWQIARFAHAGLALAPVAGTADDRGMIARSTSGTLALTYDGGATWAVVAAPPPVQIPDPVSVTAAPDGTLIAEYVTINHGLSEQVRVDFLFSRHGQWAGWSSLSSQKLGHVVLDLTPTWDRHGHATQLWGIVQIDTSTTALIAATV
jgi:hypothetical protein